MTSKLRFDGKVLLVTGGTSGIGEAVVERFVHEGGRVAFTGRRNQLGQSVASRFPVGSALFVECDHTKTEDNERCIREVISAFGRIDHLFNNAGIVLTHSVEETTESEFDAIMSVNVKAVWMVTKLALPHLRSAGGSIVNCASDWAIVADARAAAYCASKAAVLMLTKCTALECARQGVRANAVCPGDTFVRRWMEEHRGDVVEPGEGKVDDAEVEKRLRENPELPMGRVADVSEIASVVLFLFSNDASYMTGAAIPVDGGNSAK